MPSIFRLDYLWAQTWPCPATDHKVSVLCELTLGHLCYSVTDVASAQTPHCHRLCPWSRSHLPALAHGTDSSGLKSRRQRSLLLTDWNTEPCKTGKAIVMLTSRSVRGIDNPHCPLQRQAPVDFVCFRAVPTECCSQRTCHRTNTVLEWITGGSFK